MYTLGCEAQVLQGARNIPGHGMEVVIHSIINFAGTPLLYGTIQQVTYQIKYCLSCAVAGATRYYTSV